MREKGRVIEITGSVARISIKPSEACKSCPSSSICRPAGKNMIMEADNRIGAKVGDEVFVETSAKQSMIAVFFLFVFPVLLGLIAMLIAGRRGGWYMVISGLVGFALGLMFTKIMDTYFRKWGKLLPNVVEVVKS
jgi:sigma-E factor negative regulatory protein RseC